MRTKLALPILCLALLASCRVPPGSPPGSPPQPPELWESTAIRSIGIAYNAYDQANQVMARAFRDDLISPTTWLNFGALATRYSHAHNSAADAIELYILTKQLSGPAAAESQRLQAQRLVDAVADLATDLATFIATYGTSGSKATIAPTTDPLKETPLWTPPSSLNL